MKFLGVNSILSKDNWERETNVFFNLDGKSSHRACEAVLSFAKKRGLK